MADPVLEDVAAVQRDSLQTYLVDVTFAVYDADADDQTLTVEWRRGTTDPWSAAQAQTVDRRHDADNPLTSIPVASPGLAFNYTWNAFFDLPDGSFDDVFVRVTVDDGGATDQEVVGPITVSTLLPETTDEAFVRAQARRAIQERTENDFLGTGLVNPYRRGSRDFVSASGVDLVKSSVRQILGTRAAVGNFLGDLKWRPDFGSKLWVLRHRRNDDTLRGQAFAFVIEAMRWEPRVEVTQVEALDPPLSEPNELKIRVKYRIIEENVPDNQVILPEFEEVVSVAT